MKRSTILQSLLLGVLTCVGPLAVPQSAFAQYFGNNLHGDFKVNSGTQSGPGFYVVIPFSQLNADHIKDADGNTLAASRVPGFDVRALFPTIVGVTPKKLLGANYGFMVALPFTTIRPERTIPETFEPDWGSTTCTCYRCISDGIRCPRTSWRGMAFMRRQASKRRAPPTTSGLACGLRSFNWHHGLPRFGKEVQRRYDRVLRNALEQEGPGSENGDLLTLVGGAAYNVPKIGGAFGVGYYFQSKVSDDSGDDVRVSALRALNLYRKNGCSASPRT